MKPSPPIVTVSMKVINVNAPNEWYPNPIGLQPYKRRKRGFSLSLPC